jgi:hypothetical protein
LDWYQVDEKDSSRHRDWNTDPNEEIDQEPSIVLFILWPIL